jgi:hypothetical protein
MMRRRAALAAGSFLHEALSVRLRTEIEDDEDGVDEGEEGSC